MENLQCDFQSYDIRRICSVYFDTLGEKAWTKAWFNGRDVGEPAHPISRKIAAAFINGRITKDEMLSRYYPKQMAICRQAVEQTREAMMGIK